MGIPSSITFTANPSAQEHQSTWLDHETVQNVCTGIEGHQHQTLLASSSSADITTDVAATYSPAAVALVGI